MMLPVGRLILLRSMPADELVKATIWYTVPPAIGAIAGPLVGGAVVTYLSWQWLFLMNVPIALGACFFALKFLDKDGPGEKIPLDLVSYALLALTLLGVLSGLAGSGKGLLSTHVCIGLIVGGIAFAWLYLGHAKRATHPVMDFSLLRFPTFNASIVGGFGIRVGQGAIPFLLPLLFQIGFGLSPIAAGSLIFVSGVGSLMTRPVLIMAMRRYGFRNMLIGTTIMCSLLYFSFALFRPGIPYLMMVALLLLSGASRGMLLVGMNTLGYTEIPGPKMSYATAMSTMAQQVSNTFGVALAVMLLNIAMQVRGSAVLVAEDFAVGFLVLGLFNALALFYFVPLPSKVGAELTTSTETPS
jgi:hypothetical protein